VRHVHRQLEMRREDPEDALVHVAVHRLDL
jgi:hypothetical protein